MRIDHTDEDSIARCTRSVTCSLTKLHANLELELATAGAAFDKELDVRLVSNEDGELWFATGDVRYDTVHGAACGATTLMPGMSADDIASCAKDLVLQVVDQLAEQAA